MLSISEASQMLSVSEGALRQWTDDGLINAFVTPGGHRRYNEADLKKFMKSHPRMLGLKDLVTGLKATAPKHREVGHIPFEGSRFKLNREAQEHFSRLGRRILSLIIKYISEPGNRNETIKLIREVGSEHGEVLYKMGLSLTDSVEAFILHRDPIMNAVTHLIRKRDGVTGRVAEAIPLVAHVMDEALVSLVAAHQQYQSSLQRDSKEDTPT